MRLPYIPRPAERPRPRLLLDHIIASGEAHLRRILISYGSRMSFSSICGPGSIPFHCNSPRDRSRGSGDAHAALTVAASMAHLLCELDVGNFNFAPS
jgi:hypothetical protein